MISYIVTFLGLYYACEHDIKPAKVPWIVCKAISDWADGEKNDDWQPYAAAVAASLVKHVMSTCNVPGMKTRSSGECMQPTIMLINLIL